MGIQKTCFTCWIKSNYIFHYCAVETFLVCWFLPAYADGLYLRGSRLRSCCQTHLILSLWLTCRPEGWCWPRGGVPSRIILGLRTSSLFSNQEILHWDSKCAARKWIDIRLSTTNETETLLVHSLLTLRVAFSGLLACLCSASRLKWSQYWQRWCRQYNWTHSSCEKSTLTRVPSASCLLFLYTISNILWTSESDRYPLFSLLFEDCRGMKEATVWSLEQKDVTGRKSNRSMRDQPQLSLLVEPTLLYEFLTGYSHKVP